MGGSTPVAQQIWTWVAAAFERTGAHASMGSGLYAAYRQAGLDTPQVALHAVMGGDADWPGHDFVTDSMASLLPVLERFGIATAEQVDVDSVAEKCVQKWRARDDRSCWPPS